MAVWSIALVTVYLLWIPSGSTIMAWFDINTVNLAVGTLPSKLIWTSSTTRKSLCLFLAHLAEYYITVMNFDLTIHLGLTLDIQRKIQRKNFSP